MSAFDSLPLLKKTLPSKLVLIFILFSMAIILTGAFYYESQKKRVYSEQEKNLTAIASLKIAQIERWHKERLGDATVIRDDKSVINIIEQYFNNSNSGLKSDLLFWMNSIKKKSDYSNFLITDTMLKVRLSVLASDSLPGENIKNDIRSVLRSHNTIMTDLHRSVDIPFIHIDILVPLLDSVNNKQLTVGVAILRIDPSKDLFPLIQSWPNTSKSSETLLIRKDGDSVLYINELRHVKNTALNLRLAMTNKNLLATKAADGLEGIAEGIDYRNIRVLGSLHKIPDLPWYMVAKVDEDEILAPLKRLVVLIIAIVILLILINASVFGFWIWQQRVKFYKQRLKDESVIHESEENLRETNEYLTNLFNYANAPIIVWDSSLLITRFNRAFEELSGYTSNEVIGKKIDILFSNAEAESSMKLINSAIVGKRWDTVEIRIQRKDGDSRIVLWNSANIHDKDGKTVITTIAQGHDITERKQIEEALHENERRLREAQEMSHLGFWLWDIETGNVEWSEEVYKIFRLDPALFKPKIDSILDMSPWPEYNQRGKELISRAIENHDVGTFEQKFQRPDQSIGYYNSTFRGNYDEKGSLISIVGTVLDITERKLAEETLRESEDKFKYVFDHSVIGKSITFPDGEIHVNQSFGDMLGYTKEEMVRLKWQDITYPEDVEGSQRFIDMLLKGVKDSVRFTKRYIHKNGGIIWTDVGTALRRDANGDPLYFMTAVSNITDRKIAEDSLHALKDELEQRIIQRTVQLEALNKELEAFSYSVSHDLRAPLRAVHGYTKILLEEYEGKLDEEGKRICGIISSSATQMGELIDDLLSFSRIGKSSMNPHMLDMKQIAMSVCVELEGEEGSHKNSIKIDKLHKVFGDPTLIKHVWNNIISNAVKYSSKEAFPEIEIGSKKEKNSIVYFVKDNGVGFDMQYAHKLFGVFQRLHSEAEFEGNGVGLAIVQRIILKHEGKIWAEGEVGKGATFYFRLPVDGAGRDETLVAVNSKQ
jgi:PAS domain S-box-containing protein